MLHLVQLVDELDVAGKELRPETGPIEQEPQVVAGQARQECAHTILTLLSIHVALIVKQFVEWVVQVVLLKLRE